MIKPNIKDYAIIDTNTKMFCVVDVNDLVIIERPTSDDKPYMYHIYSNPEAALVVANRLNAMHKSLKFFIKEMTTL